SVGYIAINQSGRRFSSLPLYWLLRADNCLGASRELPANLSHLLPCVALPNRVCRYRVSCRSGGLSGRFVATLFRPSMRDRAHPCTVQKRRRFFLRLETWDGRTIPFRSHPAIGCRFFAAS